MKHEALLEKIEEANTDCTSGINTLVLNVSTIEMKEDDAQSTKDDAYFVGKWEDTPWYARDNEYILKGYRINFNSTKRILRSLFMCHNETTNVWTHLAGAIIFLFFLAFYLYVLPTLSPSSFLEKCMNYVEHLPLYVKRYVFRLNVSENSRVISTESIHHCIFFFRFIPTLGPLFIQLGCIILCLTFSATYHLFCSHGLWALKFFYKFDYTGIALLIAGSSFPPIVYGFSCYFLHQAVYLSSITFCCGLALTFTFLPKTDKPKYRNLRGLAFFLVGLLAGLPLFQSWILGTPHIDKFYWIAGGLAYLMGGMFYVMRIPERFLPGYFDYIVLPFKY